MHPFSTPWKHQKTERFSDIFRGVEKGCIGNEWVNVFEYLIEYVIDGFIQKENVNSACILPVVKNYCPFINSVGIFQMFCRYL